MAPSPSLQKLSLVCLASATVPAANALTVAIGAAYQVGLLRRAETCGGDSSLSQCGSKFPDSFCCPAKTHCLGFQDDEGSRGTSTTVICCPEGQDCNLIRPITCDISQQNASLHPSNAVHTTNLTATLTECGSKCCPFGYECNDNQLCAIADTSSSSSGQTSSASASATATATLSVSSPSGTTSRISSAAASATASATASASAAPAPSSSGKEEKHSKTGAIAGGVVGGVAALVLLVLLAIWCAKRRGTPKKPRYSGDFGPVSRTVSDPIYHPQMSSRTEFLRRDAGSSGNASIDQTLLGSPFSPKSKSPLNRNNTVTSNTSHAYGYTRPNPSPKKSYGSLLRGPGGGMAASNPGRAGQARHYAPSDMQTTTASNPLTIGLATDDGSSVYTPTPLPRSMRISTKGKEPAYSNTTVGRKPLNPTRILNPTDEQPRHNPSRVRQRPSTCSCRGTATLLHHHGL
ncbi:uncharacterized protein IWZ02DRAFT_436901 [Phyllosticta citriasiana]|uniref:uncharacterized protein n=1 Tax=Phyllosticta citriasiana TaxID=595635 RepID=UPI0030FD6D6C